jgi:hypothetical protein
MSNTFSATQAPWPQGSSAEPTAAEPIQARTPLFFAVVWLVFTSVHASFMLYAFRSQWLVLPILLMFYGVFFTVGVVMAAGHVRWWRQCLTLGRPRMLSRPTLQVGQTQALVFEGFKAQAQAASLHALWVHELGARGSKGSVHWTEQWRSKPVALQWLPSAGAVGSADVFQAQASLASPPLQAPTGSLSRWSLLVVSAHHSLNAQPIDAKSQPPKAEAMKQGWRFALDPQATSALHGPAAMPSTVAAAPLSPADQRKAVRVLAAMASLFLLGGLGWAAHNVLGPHRFSAFTFMFAFTFAWMGWLMAEVAWQLRQGGERLVNAVALFKRMARVLPVGFVLAFVWDGFGPMLMQQWLR